MSKTPISEEELRTWIIRETKRRAHVCPIESHARTAGVFDLNICSRGVEFWLELKFDPLANSKKGYKFPEVRESQVRWALQRVENGGKAFFVLYSGNTQMTYVVPGSQGRSLVQAKLAGDWERLASHTFMLRKEFIEWLVG